MDTSDLFCSDLPSTPRPDIGKILVTGATGYIGGRLVPELLARGYQVRVMVRATSPEHKERWPQAEVVTADALQQDDVSKALEGVHAAYYLLHSLLLGKKEFEAADIKAATNFRKAAEKQDVRRIIYLGGLGDIRTPLSPHLKSRMKVAQELQRGKVLTTIVRAAIIIGSGSASYEIIEHLVKKVPILCIPYWGRTKCQPISIRDVIKYLVGVLEIDETAGKTFDIGGSDILTYEKMLKIFAGLLGKKRLFVRVPFSSIGFYSYLANLLTPVPGPITFCLMEGLKNDVVCRNQDIKRILSFQPLGYEQALLDAMSREEQDDIHTRWSDAYPPAHELAMKLNEIEKTHLYKCAYSLMTDRDASALFHAICRIGGKEGWFHGNWIWRLRGVLDRMLMGVGAARGRRSESSLRINDVIDFWRVENLKENTMLLLRAEMKLPGKAWLEFRIDREGDANRLSVKAYFHANSFYGKTYWYACWPFHRFIFISLIEQIEKKKLACVFFSKHSLFDRI